MPSITDRIWRPRATLLLCLSALVVYGYWRRQSESPAMESSVSRYSISADSAALLGQPQNAFFASLYKQIIPLSDENIAFSPTSVFVGLMMTAEGATGETRSQLDQVLNIGPMQRRHEAISSLLQLWQQEDSVLFALANRIFVERSLQLNHSFQQLTSAHYFAEASPADFKYSAEKERQRINTYIESATESLIRDLLPRKSLSANTRLVLTNALYFKANWATKFTSGAMEPFRLMNGQEVDTQMMVQQARMRILQRDGYRVCEVPYKGENFVLDVFLPDDVRGMAVVDRAVVSGDAVEAMDTVRQQPMQLVQLKLPKMKMTTDTLQLKQALKALGMIRAFDASNAEFDGIAAEPLWIDEVYHKAAVEFTETGTEAAAATAVVAVALSVVHGPPAIQVHCDHPFMFVIRDVRVNAPLFVGRVMNP
eukprot:TRINITY_DN3186_c0_g1_i4.p1 TRINITY_DN3186_c0_g1~~TRINITY_DN3186_c0_g1_i4.p1  ORF type:complete len:424 (-),score=102.19 TRINITY_DN3186_c0_g1_i4:226-1497(-)